MSALADLGTLAVDVVETALYSDRWTAALHIDGQATSFDCTHLHHSRVAAERCVGRVARKVEAARGDSVEVLDAPRGDYRIVVLTRSSDNGRGGTTTVEHRFTYLDETRRISR